MSQKELEIQEWQAQGLAGFFKIFGDATRIKILFALLSSELCVGELAEVLNMNQSAISHQLRIIKESGLITSRREGQMVIYSLADDHVKRILSQGKEHIEE